MADDASAARTLENAETIALEDIDVSNIELWRTNSHWPYFARLRREAPVHYCRDSQFGPYWSITRYNDIMAVETNPKVFSSDYTRGGIAILDQTGEDELPMFIAMDPPRHDEQRKVVAPIVAPTNLLNMEGLIRERAGKILDGLPIGETFDWVERVSIELTTQMLATLFDFPFEDRYKLTWWSDVANVLPAPGELVETTEEQTAVLMECLEYFVRLWNERVNAEPQFNLVSMLAHGEATRDMTPLEYLGNVILLIVGGNDTTRNSITGSVLALNENPDQYQLLRDHPELIPSMVSETIRWQTPLAHMRRTATEDFELGGQQIKKGDKVILWYVSGNRDDSVIERADEYIIGRERPRQHIAFGFGIHRCVGNRLAEMQLRVLWEEILKRYPKIEVVEAPVRLANPFIKGYSSLKVRIPPSEVLPARQASTETVRPPRERPKLYRQPLHVLAAACLVSAGGGLLFNVMPALLSAAATRFGLNDGQLGMVGSSFLAGFALVAVTSNQWIRRFNWRVVTGLGAVIGAGALAACGFAPSYQALLAELVAAGFGLGVMYTVCIAIVSENQRPDPAFGIKLAAEVFLAVGALLALTSFVTARWGFAGSALTLAGFVLVAAAVGIPGLPARRSVIPQEERFAMARAKAQSRLDAFLHDWAPWLGLAALFVSFAGLAALWAFVNEIAASFGVDSGAAAGAVALGLVVSGVAGLAAAFIGDRFGRVRPLAVSMGLAIVGAAILIVGHGFWAYITGMMLAAAFWNFPMAYQMGLIASADGRGRVAVLMPAALAVGGALGPVLGGGLLAAGQGYLPLYAMFAAGTALGLAAFMVVGRRVTRSATGL